MISKKFDLSEVLPEESREAFEAAETYTLFFVFENYLRDFILNVLSEADSENWWDAVPQHVRDEVTKLEENEDRKMDEPRLKRETIAYHTPSTS